MAAEFRIGSGWDSHEFVPGRPLWLGGLAIPHAAGLSGHSDGDVLLHALCDALLGATGDGDIGVHFPSSDPQWKDAPSRRFVEHALRRVRAAGWELVNFDANLILESPRLGPWREPLRVNLSTLLGVSRDRVSVKAKTPEGLGTPNTAIATVTLLLTRS